MSGNLPPRVAALDGSELNLDQPGSFYSTIEKLRGASTFKMEDPLHSADTARQPLDNCDTKPKVLSALFPSTTTTTTTTSTTVPGS